ncbi:MAG: methyltransferase domain-containing protein [Chloroflexi bacterium]|nr:methyltransferase domain-containing protein [Chloroflexota bacterium]
MPRMSGDEGLGARWDEAYEKGSPPWDIGRPQPAFRRLADAGELIEPVLDSGCGTGEHTLMLAERGFEVVGVDISSAAIERARAKARIRGLDPQLVVGDALALERLGRRFGSVIDSGMFHTLEDGSRGAYAQSLAAVLEPGGRVYLLCFSEHTPGIHGPRRVTQEEIRSAFADGWTVEAIEPDLFDVRPEFGDDAPHAWLATIRRAGGAAEEGTFEPEVEMARAPETEPRAAPAPEPVPASEPVAGPEPVADPEPEPEPEPAAVEPAPEPAPASSRPTIVVVGSPTALGGHFDGMDRGPAALRDAGLLERLRSMPGLTNETFANRGDAPIERGWAPDDDPRMKNRQRIIDYLPALASHVEGALRAGGGDGAPPRLLLHGGDCTSHAAAMAGLKRLSPGARFAIAWFDAHGDFNTPETTPSGNVWGMPFAMLCGRGDAGLVAACDGPTVREEDAALLGGQVLDEQESRNLAASPVAHFGAGMLAGEAGLAALDGWARTVGARTDGLYVAFDLDAIDASEGMAVAMPEPGGLSVDTAIAALRILASTNRVVGFGPTATMPRPELDFGRHVEIVARLAEAALA